MSSLIILKNNYLSYKCLLIIIISFLFLQSCKDNAKTVKAETATTDVEINEDSISKIEPIAIKIEKKVTPLTSLKDTTFVRLADYSDGFEYDLRYATNNNFLKEKA